MFFLSSYIYTYFFIHKNNQIWIKDTQFVFYRYFDGNLDKLFSECHVINPSKKSRTRLMNTRSSAQDMPCQICYLNYPNSVSVVQYCRPMLFFFFLFLHFCDQSHLASWYENKLDCCSVCCHFRQTALVRKDLKHSVTDLGLVLMYCGVRVQITVRKTWGFSAHVQSETIFSGLVSALFYFLDYSNCV